MFRQWSPHQQEPVAPFKERDLPRIPHSSPGGSRGFQFAGIESLRLAIMIASHAGREMHCSNDDGIRYDPSDGQRARNYETMRFVI
jgi:hypothetical protein